MDKEKKVSGTQEMDGFGIIPDPEVFNTLSDTYTPIAQAQKEKEISDIRAKEWTLLDEAFSVNNSLYSTAQSLAVEYGYENDPNFDALKVPQLYENIPSRFHATIARSGSLTEAYAKRAYIEEYMANQEKLLYSGWSGMGASLVAGLVDADALLIPVGGTYFGKKVGTSLVNMGVKPGRVLGFAQGAVSGLESGAIVSTLDATFGITGDPANIPMSLLTGMGFGATLGTGLGVHGISRDLQLLAAKKSLQDFIKATENNFIPPLGENSVGAAQAQPVPTPTNVSTTTATWFERAANDTNAMNARNTLAGLEDAETTNTESFIGRVAQRIQNWVDKSPLKSLYTEVANLGVIGNKLAYDLLSHPGGLMDGSANPAAHYDAVYTAELSTPIQLYHELAMDYLGRPNLSLRERIKNAFVGKSNYRQFDRAVRLELESRYHTGKGDPNVHRAVKEMADALDEMHARALEIQQGRAGEIPVSGSENIKQQSGYYSRRWSGEAIREAEADPNIGPKKLEDALVQGYKNVFANFNVTDEELIRSIVRSIITRAKALDEGIDTNLVGLLRTEGKEFLRNTLKNNSIPDNQIDSILAALTGDAKERSKPGFLKERIELDMRTRIPGTNKLLIDLLEPDLYKATHYYIRRVAGTSAMARKGYQLGDKVDIIESIVDELNSTGGRFDAERVKDILETAFSYFGAGAIGKGIDPLVLSSMRLTRQSLLGTLGLTQLSELGNVVSMVGVEAAMKAFYSEMRAAISGVKTPFTQELYDAFIFLDKDHVLFDDELALDLVGQNQILQSEFVQNAHKYIAFGDKIAGYTSLFYQSLSFSQRLAVSSINHKIYKVLEDMNTQFGDLTPAVRNRLLELGIDEPMADAIQKHISNGIIKYDADGNLSMGFDKWAPGELDAYKRAMHTFVVKAVQKNIAGEVPYWATKQFGQFISQLRMFPLMAFQKQFLRNMRHADKTAASSLLFNLAVAAIVYSVSETIKGRGGDLDSAKIAKGALNYAPTTGWLPMATDPLAEIMGMPELRMNKYGPPGRATDGIIPVPPAIPTLNRMFHLPGAVMGLYDGLDRNEVSALTSIPIIGNTYGFSALFNYLRDD